MTRRLLIACIIIGAATSLAAAQDSAIQRQSADELRRVLVPVPPKEPAEALKTFEVIDGFHLELVVAEPMVYDPVAAAFDENGLLYVAELRDYPYRPAEGERPLGRIRVLEDVDGDGRMDRSDVFADGLLWAAGVAPHRGGIFVAAAPDIWYFKDTDGDRHADVRQRIFTGFGTQKSQGSVNNLIWGVDHFLYGAGSKNGGSITRPGETDATPVDLRRNDFRFDPATGRIETISGNAQFGNTFDDWGNRFLCSQAHPIHHVVLPDRYLSRNSYLPVPRTTNNVLPEVTPVFRISPIEEWRKIRSSRRIVAGERTPESAGVNHHILDGVAGSTVYRGDAYPPGFYGNIFCGGAQTNLIHRRRLVPRGPTFDAVRTEDGTEFVRSTDIWFRPVNFVNAPDGTLWVLDLSREFLEAVHIPLDVAALLDLTSGRNRGRIYRIAPDGFKPRPQIRVGDATTAELVAYLEHPNGWHRETAHRLIHERRDRAAIEPLRKLLRESDSPQGRLHALWALQGLGALSESDLLAGLSDAHGPVREHAVRLSESSLARSAALRGRVIRLADDDDPRVRFQVAFTLGEIDDPRATEALVKLAQRDGDDPWMRSAILSSAANIADEMLEQLLRGPRANDELLSSLATIVGRRGKSDEIGRVVDAAAANGHRSIQEMIVLGIGDGLRRSNRGFGDIRADLSPTADTMLKHLFYAAPETALKSSAALGERRRAIELTGHSGISFLESALMGLLEKDVPAVLQADAIRVLSRMPDYYIQFFVPRWRTATPAVRREMLEAFVARPARIDMLLDAVENGPLAPADLSAFELTRLRDRASDAQKARIAKIEKQMGLASRREVVERYEPALELEGDIQRGIAVFEQQCMVCHRLGDRGRELGPNLALSRNQTPEALLREILDPNATVEPDFLQYVIIDKTGRSVTGVIASESAASITIRRADAEETILRQDVDQIIGLNRSLMPEGLEQAIDKQQMADLLAFLLAAQYDIGTEAGGVSPSER